MHLRFRKFMNFLGFEPYHIIGEYDWNGNYKTYWRRKK
jgi:hypothetical protein